MNLSSSLSGLASIIVAGGNQLELTRECLAALWRHTRPPWELIVVDNGSSDETSAFLASLRGAAPVPVTVIANATSRALPAAFNQGLKAARGEFLVLLNNDVVVTDSWLDQLIALATAHPSESPVIGCAGTSPAPSASAVIGCAGTTPPPSASPVIGCATSTPPGPPFTRGGKWSLGGCVDGSGAGAGEPRPATSLLPTAYGLPRTPNAIGLVGPMSNHAAPPQLVEGLPYHDLRAMHAFARQWRNAHRGKWFAVSRLAGSCLLMKRAVYEAIGGLNEQAGPEAWVDELAARAQQAGISLAVAHDLFVHRHRSGDAAAAWGRVASSWDQVPGFFDFAAVYDAAVAAGKDGDVFVEVGCLAGRSTCYLASRIRESGKAITLYAIDPSTGSPSDSTGRVIAPAVGGSLAGILHRNILGCGLAEIVVPILTNSVRAARMFPDETVAFCFIDADHSYASVTADLRAWWPKVRAGGMLAGHDYRQPAPWLAGLTPAVHDFFGVKDAAHPAMPGCWAMVKHGTAGEDAAAGLVTPVDLHLNNGNGVLSGKKVLFASVHSVLDFSNGASVATLDVLQGLTTRGFECQAFCTAKLDLQTEVSFEKMIGDLREPYEVRASVCGVDRAQVLYTRRRQVPITLIRHESTRHTKQSKEEIQTALRFFARFLGTYRPDVLLTYGGDPITQGMIAVAKSRRIPVVFAIHNFGYTHTQHFSRVDFCIVPSEFACRHYRDKLGLDCRVLPNPVDWERVRVTDRDPRYVTFVNPALYKGAYPFVRIAQELGRRRPDIPLLVVESRATQQTLGACGLRDGDHPNIQIMPVTTDPRRFWRMTKVLLMPSLWWENQPLVAIEAMINGIPVIGSDRGGIPETLGDAGVLLPLPERLTPESRVLPTAEEVEPWIEAIIRLWDDRSWYEERSTRARNEAERWRPDRIQPLYADFLGGVCVRGGGATNGSRLNHADSNVGANTFNHG